MFAHNLKQKSNRTIKLNCPAEAWKSTIDISQPSVCVGSRLLTPSMKHLQRPHCDASKHFDNSLIDTIFRSLNIPSLHSKWWTELQSETGSAVWVCWGVGWQASWWAGTWSLWRRWWNIGGVAQQQDTGSQRCTVCPRLPRLIKPFRFYSSHWKYLSLFCHTVVVKNFKTSHSWLSVVTGERTPSSPGTVQRLSPPSPASQTFLFLYTTALKASYKHHTWAVWI